LEVFLMARSTKYWQNHNRQFDRHFKDFDDFRAVPKEKNNYADD